MNQAIETKKCPKCQQVLPLVEFSKNACRKSGLECYCKKCMGIKSSLWSAKNPEKIYVISQRWNLKNPEKRKASTKRWRNNNPEKTRAMRRNWAINNPEKVKIMDINYRCKHIMQARARTKQWKLDNPDKVRMNRAKYANKLLNNPILKLFDAQRGRIRRLLKSKQLLKDQHTIEYIGCTQNELKKYIESQFDSKMSWDNYGINGWHVDHIVPCSFFDIYDPTELKICLHYTNYRPLWGIENLEKSSKLLNINLNLPLFKAL